MYDTTTFKNGIFLVDNTHMTNERKSQHHRRRRQTRYGKSPSYTSARQKRKHAEESNQEEHNDDENMPTMIQSDAHLQTRHTTISMIKSDSDNEEYTMHAEYRAPKRTRLARKQEAWLLKAQQQHPTILTFPYGNIKWVVLRAIDIDIQYYHCASNQLRQDVQVLRKALQKDPHILRHTSIGVYGMVTSREQLQLLIDALPGDGMILRRIPQDLRTREMIETALHNDPMSIQFAQFWIHNPNLSSSPYSLTQNATARFCNTTNARTSDMQDQYGDQQQQRQPWLTPMRQYVAWWKMCFVREARILRFAYHELTEKECESALLRDFDNCIGDVPTTILNRRVDWIMQTLERGNTEILKFIDAHLIVSNETLVRKALDVSLGSVIYMDRAIPEQPHWEYILKQDGMLIHMFHRRVVPSMDHALHYIEMAIQHQYEKRRFFRSAYWGRQSQWYWKHIPSPFDNPLCLNMPDNDVTCVYKEMCEYDHLIYHKNYTYIRMISPWTMIPWQHVLPPDEPRMYNSAYDNDNDMYEFHIEKSAATPSISDPHNETSTIHCQQASLQEASYDVRILHLLDLAMHQHGSVMCSVPAIWYLEHEKAILRLVYKHAVKIRYAFSDHEWRAWFDLSYHDSDGYTTEYPDRIFKDRVTMIFNTGHRYATLYNMMKGEWEKVGDGGNQQVRRCQWRLILESAHVPRRLWPYATTYCDVMFL